MIEITAKEYLETFLTPSSIPVYFEIPDGVLTLDKFVVIERTGGGGDSKLFSATLAIQSYGATLYDAAELNETIKGYMREFKDHPLVSDCVLNSDYNYTDPESKRYRYQAVYNIIHF